MTAIPVSEPMGIFTLVLVAVAIGQLIRILPLFSSLAEMSRISSRSMKILSSRSSNDDRKQKAVAGLSCKMMRSTAKLASLIVLAFSPAIAATIIDLCVNIGFLETLGDSTARIYAALIAVSVLLITSIARRFRR